MIGAVFALRGGVPGLPKQPPFIAAAQGPTKVQPPSEDTVGTANEPGANLLEGRRPGGTRQGPRLRRAACRSERPGVCRRARHACEPCEYACRAWRRQWNSGQEEQLILRSSWRRRLRCLRWRSNSLIPNRCAPFLCDPTVRQFPRRVRARPTRATARRPVKRRNRPRSQRRNRQPTLRGMRSRRPRNLICRPNSRQSLLHGWWSPRPMRPARRRRRRTSRFSSGPQQSPRRLRRRRNPSKRPRSKPRARRRQLNKPSNRRAATPAAGWSVQLAAPKSEAEAKSTVARLNTKYASALNGSSIGVHKAVVNGETIYRLRVGGLSKADAAALCARLKGDGGECFIAK